MSGEIRTNRATNETQSFRLDFGVCSCALYFRCESLGFEMWNVRIQKIYFRAFTHYANREDDNLSCIRALMRSTKSPSSDATRTQTHKSVKFCFTQHIIHFLVYLTISFCYASGIADAIYSKLPASVFTLSLIVEIRRWRHRHSKHKSTSIISLILIKLNRNGNSSFSALPSPQPVLHRDMWNMFIGQPRIILYLRYLWNFELD